MGSRSGSSKLLFQSENSSQVILMPEKQKVIDEEIAEEIEHRFPFQTQVKGDSFSINTVPMRVSVKRPGEFDDPHKLSKGHVVSKSTGVDLPYTMNRNSRTKTQGLFATDPQRT